MLFSCLILLKGFSLVNVCCDPFLLFQLAVELSICFSFAVVLSLVSVCCGAFLMFECAVVFSLAEDSVRAGGTRGVARRIRKDSSTSVRMMS